MKMNRGAVLAMCNIGTSSLDRYMERGFFPMPTNTGLWDSEHIKLWVNSHGKGPLGKTYGYGCHGSDNKVWPTWDETVAAAEFHVSNAKAKLKAQTELNQKREGAVNLRSVTERLRDIKNMDEVEAFYKECVYNMGINTLRNGEADG